MTRILALLACLLLAACASPLKRYGPGSGYNYSPEFDKGGTAPMLILDGVVMKVGEPSQAEQDAWVTYHLVEPHLDEAEEAAIRNVRRAQYFDQGTTALGLACGLKEANPLFLGARVALIPVAHWGLRKYLTSYATKSPRAYSSAPDMAGMWLPNATAGTWNIGNILAHCVL